MSIIQAAADRPIPLRRRPDLQISEVQFQQERSWIVKDPLSLRYHRLKLPEMITMEMLDGCTTARQIQARLQDEYPTHLVRLVDLQQLISLLFRAGLLISDMPGQGLTLWKKNVTERYRRWTSRLSNVLAIQLPGVDADPLLRRLVPWCGWFFSKAGIALWLVLTISALGLLLGNWSEFQQRLPGLHDFFAADRFWLLIVVLSVTKVIHELGHGLSCRYFGGECHEIGLMLLVLTPAMYCDTSDSWRLSNKWHRMFIGAAGMYAELALASIATLVWWYTTPGMLHYLCLNVMLIASVSSAFFNANPLLRFDGYYILSDFLEVPNLTEKSRCALLNVARRWCLGLAPIAESQMPQRNVIWFALYSVASFCYRWFILIVIAWFLMTLFRPYGLQVVGTALVILAVVGTIGVPLWRMVSYLRIPGVIEEVNWTRAMMTVLVVLMMLAAVCWIPLPRSLVVPVVVTPDDAYAQRVYVAIGGALDQVLVRPGEHVEAGAHLAELTNREAQARLARLEGDRQQKESHLQSLQRISLSDAQSHVDLPTARAQIDEVNRQIAEVKQDLERLTLVAKRAGVILPPHHRAEVSQSDELQLGEWYDSPFDIQNLGMQLPTGSLFCFVGDPHKMRVHLLISEQDAQLVDVGQHVKVLLDGYPNQTLSTELDQISRQNTNVVPVELMDAMGGPIPTTADPSGDRKSLFVMHEATAPIHDPPMELLPGCQGVAKVTLQPAPLGTRLWKWLRHTVDFK